jgi:hypothetical protein
MDILIILAIIAINGLAIGYFGIANFSLWFVAILIFLLAVKEYLQVIKKNNE